ADVAVGDLAGEVDLALEPLQCRLVGGDVGADGFQRHVVAERGVEGVVDLAHAALGEEALDAVAAGHQLAGEEGGAEPLRLLATAGNGVSRSGGRGRWMRRTRDGSLRRRRRGGELVLDALGDLR